MTFKQLQAAAAKASTEIREIVDLAEINADDTIHTDKAAPIDQWEAIALASVSDNLASGAHSAATLRWFERRGIRF